MPGIATVMGILSGAVLAGFAIFLVAEVRLRRFVRACDPARWSSP
jgi:hypothetical protein